MFYKNKTFGKNPLPKDFTYILIKFYIAVKELYQKIKLCQHNS